MRKESIVCPECGEDMILRRTSKFKTKNGQDRLFWGCSQFPACQATLGAHPDGRPLGKPGTAEEKLLRIQAHRQLDRIFGDWEAISRKQKRNIYKFLRENCPREHIAEMDKTELLVTIHVLSNEQRRNDVKECDSGRHKK